MTDSPALKIKPVFIGWIVLVAQIPVQIFLTFWGGGFFGVILETAFTLDSKKMPAESFLICGACFFVLIPLLTYFCKKYNYKKSEFRIYEDRIEYEEGFLTIYKKTIRLRDVTEVSLRRGVLQRTCRLGTIYVATPATGSSPYNNNSSFLGFSNTSKSGLAIRDIADADAIFEQLKSMVERIKSPSPLTN